MTKAEPGCSREGNWGRPDPSPRGPASLQAGWVQPGRQTPSWVVLVRSVQGPLPPRQRGNGGLGCTWKEEGATLCPALSLPTPAAQPRAGSGPLSPHAAARPWGGEGPPACWHFRWGRAWIAPKPDLSGRPEPRMLRPRSPHTRQPLGVRRLLGKGWELEAGQEGLGTRVLVGGRGTVG